MNTWWTAIELDTSSYEEIKHRKVIAQGWSNLGTLSSLLPLIGQDEEGFMQIIQIIGDTTYKEMIGWDKDRNNNRAPRVMWNLLSIKNGDLIVAIEGTKVKGICEIKKDAIETYMYQPEYDYAQAVGFPVEWIDWSEDKFGFTPTAPAQSVLGIRRLHTEQDEVVTAWQKYKSKPL